MEKVLVAMSGGVDSAVAAYLIKKQGFSASGVTLKLFDVESVTLDENNSCCKKSDIALAEEVAKKLGIEHEVINFCDNFKEKVIEKFVRVYQEGGTPNPCIDCNREIKFKKILDEAEKNGASYIATGHYVRREFDEKTGKFVIKKGLDETKDQSYVLYSLTQEQVKRTLFPLGELTKNEVRKIAEENGFINANKPDSQDICFVPDGKYAKFIEDFSGIESYQGDFVTKSGKVLGRHKGHIHYTIGQRKGLSLSVPEPVYVCEKNTIENIVVVDTIEHLFTDSLIAEDVNLIFWDEIVDGVEVLVKTRYKQKEVKARLYNEKDGRVSVKFSEPVKAVTRGQAVVFYDNDILLGGGTIV